MQEIRTKAAAAALFAILLSGCASQNAMSLVPAAVQAEIAAEKSRPPDDGPAAKSEANDGDRAGKAAETPAALPATRRDRPAQSGERNAAHPAALADQADLLEQALAYQHSANETTEPEAEEDAWRRLLELRKSGAIDPAATASVASAEEPDYPVILAFSGEGATLDRESDIRLRLLRRGGRVPAQIVVGRIDDAGAALALAGARGRQIAAIAGGDPRISYDPLAAPGGAVIRYYPIGTN